MQGESSDGVERSRRTPKRTARGSGFPLSTWSVLAAWPTCRKVYCVGWRPRVFRKRVCCVGISSRCSAQQCIRNTDFLRPSFPIFTFQNLRPLTVVPITTHLLKNFVKTTLFISRNPAAPSPSTITLDWELPLHPRRRRKSRIRLPIMLIGSLRLQSIPPGCHARHPHRNPTVVTRPSLIVLALSWVSNDE